MNPSCCRGVCYCTCTECCKVAEVPLLQRSVGGYIQGEATSTGSTFPVARGLHSTTTAPDGPYRASFEVVSVQAEKTLSGTRFVKLVFLSVERLAELQGAYMPV